MIVVPLITVTSAMLASNAVDEAAWSSATTYALGALVRVGEVRYSSLQAGNTNNDPTAPGSLWWVEDGPINSLRMFDVSAATTTQFTAGASLTITAGQNVTALGLSNLVGTSVNVVVRNGATVLALYTRNILTSDGSEWGYFFADPQQTTDLVFADLPVPNTAIDVIVNGTTGTSVGLCAIGRQVYIGDAEKGASVSTELRGRDYTDALGNAQATERGYARTLSCTLQMDRADFGRITALMEGLMQQYALWVVAPDVGDYDSAQLVGRYQRAVRVLDANGSQSISLALEVTGAR